MKNISLSDLEKSVIKDCNDKISEYGLKAEKVKIKRSYYYYITKNGRNILGNSDLVQFKSFCDNDDDIKLLADIG